MDTAVSRIVVGVDGSPSALAAVDWSAAAARRYGLPLELVHAYPVNYPVGMSDPGALPPPAQDWVPGFLEEARAEVARAWPDVDVSVLAVPATPASTLVSMSRTAALVVVGAHGRSTVSRIVLGSVSRHVTAHAHCPAVVVRGEQPDPALPVAVGIDDSPTAQAALAWAFHEASLRRASLTVFHAWEETTLTGYGIWAPPPGLEEDLRQAAHQLMAGAVRGWVEKYPDVAVHEIVERRHPLTAVVEHSRHAQLLVLGAHGRGAFRGMTIGSLPATVVHQSACPVVVVPPDTRESRTPDDG